MRLYLPALTLIALLAISNVSTAHPVSLAQTDSLTATERRVAEDRPDCFWLHVVTDCDTEPKLQEPVGNPAKLQWVEVTKVQHYRLSTDKVKDG